MKFFLPFLTIGAAAAARAVTKVDNVNVDSPLGAKLMSKARKLENDDEVDFTWVADFSIKFQGCHHVTQWNDDADGEDEVRIQTKRLIRFRLCPTSSCSTSNGGGCSSGYGDYIIDMNTFLETYYEAVDDYNEYRCEYVAAMECSCGDDDQKDDGFDQETCEYNCWAERGMEDICSDNDEDGEEKFDLADYVE
jgi:hypothetical protein